ncbi:hypothetical protein NDN01_00435 [Sphingomonas sp. QA11]|uniref:DUF6880 family protein n=1 Tax=Sphingomonas sp. QA11 TaxID=2950605 RepID=UPI00234BD50A|nr:DUF6880 family protein [Sphingomonas sp. QA11]WCM27441.1 hypothetical protein NDN01_00435 [Sphingomonas sp. QA11]
MASTKTLTAKNLEALGAPRLAELLIDLSMGDATAKRRLRLELAGQSGSAEVAHQVRKRLATIAKSRSYVDWDKVKPIAADLEGQYRAIIDHVAKADPREALDLLWRLTALAESVLARCDDSNGRLMAVFETALPDLGRLAGMAGGDAKTLADRVFDALCDNGYGQYDALIKVLAEPLGRDGLGHLKERLTALGKEPPTRPPDEEREVIGWSSRGPIYADLLAERRHARVVTTALRDIAVLQEDVDGFIAQYGEDERRRPGIAADIADHLLAAGRTEEAWQAIEAADRQRAGWVPFEWEQTRAVILDALGRGDEAQEFRWSCFARSLNAAHLRAYLKRLPDFDDIDAENRAMAHVSSAPDVHQALGFLVDWSAIERANRLVLDRFAELNGDHYHALGVAADALEQRYPLAATLLYRAMIDFALIKARYKRYPHAARYLEQCESLARRIENYGSHASHEEYHASLRVAHGRKTGFWQA